MTPARLQAIEEIFHAALDQEPDRIGRFVETACEGDELLRRKVEALLASHQRAGRFIEIPAAGIATRIIENGQADLFVGQTIGHYKILKRIGIGGMGEVYLASDITAGRNAALKVLPRRFTGDAERLRRFQQEARAVVGLNHPNILTVYEIGEYDSSHYIASELIEGETLRQRLARGPMGLNEAIDVASQVATALAAAHQAGIVHRDIKPENIMLRPDGYVKVLDFGIAKLAEQEVPVTMAEEEAVSLVETHLGSIIGTVRYMSPEQARGAPVDKCTDIWSLGVVLYEMAAGRAPFIGDTPREVMASILGREPPRLTSSIAQTPAELRRIASKALSKEREKRYQSAHELLEALKSLRRGMEFKAELERSSTAPSWRRWRRSPIAVALLLVGAALALALPLYRHRNLTTSSVPEKSIAVLPFESFNDNKDNSDFAAGIQDDVLTSLAQIHELKVISRTSVMAYQKPGGRNMREISRALGVANVLEGSVRRTGNRVLVNVQLIDARNDRHLWAERYDRTVADSIGLQGELATQIAAALKTTLAPEEKARLDAGPTTNSEAYVLYLTALGKEATDEIAAEQLYVQATALDPKFALAHARASLLNSRIASYDQERAGQAKARAQAEEALRLSPTLGEAHMALGLCLYWVEKKYEAALKEFEVAAATSPNNAEIYTYVGGIYRRQGRWREAVASSERALSLDPRNARIAFQSAINHLFVRDWPAAAAGYKRALEITPDRPDSKIGLAYLEVVQNNNPAAGRRILQDIPARLDSNGEVAFTLWDMAMLERDYAVAEKLLNDLPVEKFQARTGPKTYYEGRTALARGDNESAQRYFAATIPVIEKSLLDRPDDAERHASIGLLYAYMHRKEDAIRESRLAVELEPESQDAFHSAIEAANLAMVYALIGEQDPAIRLIERLLSTPGPIQWIDNPQNITLAELRLRWEWDSLRSNPRFQKILSAPEPKTVLIASQQVAPAARNRALRSCRSKTQVTINRTLTSPPGVQVTSSARTPQLLRFLSCYSRLEQSRYNCQVRDFAQSPIPDPSRAVWLWR
jgi:eukaryotic-like serine/threonine-protein kinase